MNEFSIICRVIGSLFNRQPQDPLLEPLFTLIREGKLQQHWPLEQDELLARLRQHCDPQTLAADYNALFVGSECKVPPYGSQWKEGRQRRRRAAFTAARHAVDGRARRQLRRAAAGGLGWKTGRRKMRSGRRLRCSISCCCPGAAHSSAR